MSLLLPHAGLPPILTQLCVFKFFIPLSHSKTTYVQLGMWPSIYFGLDKPQKKLHVLYMNLRTML